VVKHPTESKTPARVAASVKWVNTHCKDLANETKEEGAEKEERKRGVAPRKRACRAVLEEESTRRENTRACKTSPRCTDHSVADTRWAVGRATPPTLRTRQVQLEKGTRMPVLCRTGATYIASTVAKRKLTSEKCLDECPFCQSK